MKYGFRKLLYILFFYVVFDPSQLAAYDQVHAEKTIPFASRKTEPSLLRRDKDGHLWTLDQSNSILQKLSMEGKVVHVIKPGKTKSSLFKKPIDFVFSSGGGLLVSDVGLSRVAWIEDGKLKFQIPVNSPAAVAVSRDDVIAVGDEGERAIRIYSLDGVLLHFLSPPITDKLKEITALAFSPDGLLWVLDGGQGVLHRFSAERNWLGATKDLPKGTALTVDNYGYAYVTLREGRWVEINPSGDISGTFGARGKKPGQLSEPLGAVLASDNQLWVAEAGNLRLQLFTIVNAKKENPLRPLPASRLQVRFGAHVNTVYQAGFAKKSGGFVVLNKKKSALEMLDDKGSAVKSFSYKSKKSDLFEPIFLTEDKAGEVWVTDSGDHKIKRVDFEKGVLEKLGEKGKKEGSLNSPEFLAIRPDHSYVVSDKGGSRVQVLNPKGLFLFSVGGKNSSRFKTVTGLAANAEMIAVADNGAKALLFFDANGKYVRSLANKDGEPPYWKDIVAMTSADDGRFYVLDEGSKRVRVFDAAGKFLGDISVLGNGLTMGANNKVAVFEDKGTQIYEAHVVPRASTKLEAVDDAGNLQVSWAAIPEANEYRVYRSSGNAPYEVLIKTKSTETSDANVVPGTSYRYAVTGVNSIGYEGNWVVSDPIKATRRRDVSLISISSAAFDSIFTAAFKFYVTKPIGSVTLRNNDARAYRDVKLSLSLKRYTDFPTETMIKSIEAGEEKSIPVTMTFNDTVLELTENTPVQAEVVVSYFEDNVQKAVTQNAPMTLYSRNAISWEETSRISSFITPRDLPVVDYSRAAIRAFLTPLKTTPLPKQLAKIALLVESVGALGMAYVPDPKTPYAEVAGKPEALDYVAFPRETLSRKLGDCDDTTALMCALIESVGIETMVVDAPGHVFMMADVGEEDPERLGLPLERFVEVNGRIWVPIETTKLSKGFLEAWSAAATTIAKVKDKNSIHYVSVFESSKKYPPITLVDKEPAAPPYPEEKVKLTFLPLLDKLEKERYKTQIESLKEQIRKNPANTMLHIELGMAHVEGGNIPEARNIFEAFIKDPSLEVQAAAHNNLGNLDYLESKYDGAASHYADAAKVAPTDGGVLINQARTAWKQGKNADAKQFLSQAKTHMSDWREFVTDLPAEILPAN